LPEGWSQYQKEKEVLLWPNFAFKYVGSRKEKWYDYVQLEQDEEYIVASSDMESLRKWWKQYVVDKIEIPFCEFFDRMRRRIKDALNFMTFYKQKGEFQNEKKIVKCEEEEEKKDVEEFSFENENELREFFKRKFYLKEKLMFSKSFPQEQKRFYQILIRDMKILDLIETNLEPFLLEIAMVAFKFKTKQVIVEILEDNNEFFNEMTTEIMSFVQDRLQIYQNEVLNLCQNYFEETS